MFVFFFDKANEFSTNDAIFTWVKTFHYNIIACTILFQLLQLYLSNNLKNTCIEETTKVKIIRIEEKKQIKIPH